MRVVKNALLSRVGRADYKRWTSLENLETWWDERTIELARLVPAGSRVLEFGAGRRQLQRYLPAGCQYIPSDLVDRGPGTVILDLNQRPLPDLAQLRPDVAVFGGVLEYVRDLNGVLIWLANSGATACVASFDAVPRGLGRLGRYAEMKRRCYNGYMSHFTEEQLLRSFEAAAFKCNERLTWTNQLILQFLRRQ